VKGHRFEWILGAVLAALFAAVWLWQAPGAGGKLGAAEVDAYLAKIEGRLPGEPAETKEFVARLRAWGQADDGAPVYMLNAMRYHPQLKPGPGMDGFRGTPAEANAFYENAVMPVAARVGAFPLFGGETMGVRAKDGVRSNLTGFDPAIDGWNRVLVMRYPNRRAFFELVSDPQWQRFAPYKFAALELALVPTSGQVAIPDLRWVAGGLCLIVFLAAGWWRSALAVRYVPSASNSSRTTAAASSRP
jgi:hypothetical protein